ncbi:MAG: FAD:protein FMN transferase [Clostridia bacterium]|nr:FAD:protein FMN transferase [Clostridia bacterium]
MKKSSVKKLTFFAVLSAVVLLLAVVVYDGVKKDASLEFTGYVMGSQVTGTFYGNNDDGIADEIISVMKKEEDEYISKYKESSEIYSLNKNGSAQFSEHTAQLISKSLAIAKDSGGAFDITVGALSALWNFDNYTQSVPDEALIADALQTCDYEQIKINGDVFTLGDGQQLDLGAVGKGVACDDALKVLENSEVDSAVISVGGTVLTYGENPDTDFWTVGIRSPEKDDSSVFMKLKISGTAFVSTSGSYEKYFERDGRLYHHILSTKTGYPVENGLISVTIIADSGLVADALSTACFALGPDKSYSLLEKYNADAVFVCGDGRVYITENYSDKYEAADGYECYIYEESEEYTAD